MPVVKYVPRGVRELAGILQYLKNLVIYYDPDIDGAVTGELLRRFFVAYGVDFKVHINENRQHGMKLPDSVLSGIVGSTIFLVDAGIPLSEMKRLTAMGISIINIDHHHIDHKDLIFFQDDKTGAYGLMINNQYPFEPEEQRFLSGAGVMFHVLNAMHPNFCGKDEEALVGITLLSDMRQLESDPAREFLHTTFTHKSQQMDYLMARTRNERNYTFGVQTFDRNFIDYTFSPKINALFRLNMGSEAINLFSGTFRLDNSDLDVYRKIQNSMKEAIIESAKGFDLDALTYKYVPSSLQMPYKYDMTNFIGYACSAVANKGRTSFMAVMENGRVKRGSVRGKCDDVDYLSIFRSFGFEAEGHHNAFGVISVDISKVDLNALNAEIKKAEAGYDERKYLGRLVPVGNLQFFINSPSVKIAELNNYLRDSKRFYIDYISTDHQVIITEKGKSGKAREFHIDGVKVMCFEADLELKDALILPVLENNKYINFFLKRR